jgi:hypothetical protein
MAGTLTLAADLPPDLVLLQRARTRMAQNLARLPNYTCLQTIERLIRRAPHKKPELVDLVRLEVALVEGRELFAWPGSREFVDRDLSTMVVGGAIGNGNFALHAKAVFQSSAPRFTYIGERARAGRRTLQWDFVVPQMLSGYMLRSNQQEAIVGYQGSFWVDADTLDLIRLEVRADDIPDRLRLYMASDAVEYARTPIGSEEFLLPEMSELVLVDWNGMDNRNRTRFTKCRQYSGESTLIFEDPAPESENAEPLRTLVAPANVALEVALDTPIRVGESAVGDPVTAKLTKAAKLGAGIVAPKGSLLHGRITLLRQQQGVRIAGYAVGLRFSELEFGNTRAKVNASLQHIILPHNLRGRNAFGRGLPDALARNETIFGSVFFVEGYDVQLERGLRMFWRTEAPLSEDKQ